MSIRHRAVHRWAKSETALISRVHVWTGRRRTPSAQGQPERSEVRSPGPCARVSPEHCAGLTRYGVRERIGAASLVWPLGFLKGDSDMAKAHNSKLVEARRKARELATAQQERHEKLLTLAEEFFVASDEADGVVAEAKDAAARLIKDAEEQSESKRAEAQKIIAAMVETGASVADVASRLDVTTAAVRAAVKAAGPAKEERDEADDPAAAPDEPHEQHSDAA